jgi:predicted DsbA family dithiol-disulfide isomerase
VRQIDLVEFTDPACPFAYSAEPIKWRLLWRYGDGLTWTIRAVGLARDADAQRAKGFDDERNAAVLRHFDAYGMPLTTVDRRPPAGTWDACRTIVAAREFATGSEPAVLRALRVLGLAEGRAIDDPEVLDEAARRAGLEPAEVREWAADDATARAFQADLAAARDPGPAALALDHKLADAEPDVLAELPPALHVGSAGRRYTCPSYVLRNGNRSAEVPGFQPWAAVEAAVANLVPALAPRPWAGDVAEVLTWAAGEPLATVEVAALLDRQDERDAVRDELRQAGAREQAVGTDAFWTAG